MQTKIMVKKVLILIAAALGAVSLGAQQRMTTEEVRAELRANPNKYGGVYYFNDFSDRDMCEAPKGFKPFYVSTYTRHGARYILSEKQYDHVHKSLTEAYESGNLTPFGKEIHDRFEGIYPFLKNKAGELTPSGKKQHKELGDRLYRNYPEVFKGSSRVIAHSTDVPRTIQSMTYFLEGMREHNRKMEITEYASKADKHFLNPHSSDSPKVDRWFWDEVRQENSAWRKEFREMLDRQVDSKEVMGRIFVDPMKTGFKPSDLIWDFFYLAVDMQNTPLDERFYDIFTDDDLFGLWETDNYGYYGEKGPDRYNFDHGWELGGYMLQDIIEKASKDIASGEVQGRLRFGHDGCLMALMTTLDIGTWHEYVEPDEVKNIWQVQNVPMAAGLQLIFYRNKAGKVIFKPLYLEKHVDLPLTPVAPHFYDWEEFRDHYTPIYKAAIAHLEAGAPQNVKGYVRCEGKPLKGVQVSDGVQIVKTDANGYYSMYTDKRQGFVFVIAPSGYEPVSKDGLQGDFYRPLKGKLYETEENDFELKAVDQSNYSMIFITDVHLSNDPMRHDLDIFRDVTMPFIRTKVDSLKAEGPVYTVNLGDFTHELFWGKYNYGLADGYKTFLDAGYPTMMYSIPGNHDNDPGITGEDTDFRAEHIYRDVMGPTYYSMNIGAEHWIMMDNIIYVNTPGEGKKAPGVKGARNYDRGFTPDEMAFLKADLAGLPDGAKVIICTHCPILRDSKGSFHNIPGQAEKLDKMFARFGVVDVFSGHVHRMNRPEGKDYPHMRQTMLPALSGSMWTTKTDPLISSDGENAGVVIGRYSGGDARYEWRTERYGDKVMRIYDMNEVAKYYASTPSVRAEIEEYGERTDYSSLGGSNWVYVNYWGIEPGQTVEIQEKGKSLEVEKVSDEDPLFAVSFAPQWRDEEESEIFVSHKKKVSYHMFRAKAKTSRRPITVIVRDAEGNIVRTETMKRPRAFSNDIWL